MADKAPDGNTIWDFREKLVKAGAFEKLFSGFKAELSRGGLICQEGKVADAKSKLIEDWKVTAAGGLINLIHNMARYEQIMRLDLMKPQPAETG